MIQRAIEREIEKVVRDRDKWKRLAQARAPVPSPERRAELAGRYTAAREPLFLAAVVGIGSLSRGGKGCVFRALQAVHTEAARVWNDSDAHEALRRFFPSGEDED